MKKVDEKIIRFIEEFKLINKGDKILVALSGGPDSIFLLNFLLKYRQKYNITVGVMHVNHMIRGKTADNDERFCRELCSQLKIKYHSVKRNVPSIAKREKISIEEAARNLRYEELRKVQIKFGYNKIATAHNCGDNAETVFLNLIKGTGLKGLAGIPIVRGNIIRPILPVAKCEILEFLKSNNVKYLTDESNLSSIYERNLVRNEILPLIKKQLNPKIEQTLFKSSLVLKKQSVVLNSVIKMLSEFIIVEKKDKLEIKIDKMFMFIQEIWSDLIKYSVDRYYEVELSFNDCNKIITLISSQAGKSVNISNNLTATRERDNILVHLKKMERKRSFWKIKIGESRQIDHEIISIDFVEKDSIKYSANKRIEYVDSDKVSNKFILRPWQDGDRFYPLGLSGSKKVSDFLNDQKVSVFEKRKQFVLINKKKIVWVVGHRIDDRFKVTDKTRKVLRLCLK